jgi:hypothetical protein
MHYTDVNETSEGDLFRPSDIYDEDGSEDEALRKLKHDIR